MTNDVLMRGFNVKMRQFENLEMGRQRRLRYLLAYLSPFSCFHIFKFPNYWRYLKLVLSAKAERLVIPIPLLFLSYQDSPYGSM
jgi:hypothetical protein